MVLKTNLIFLIIFTASLNLFSLENSKNCDHDFDYTELILPVGLITFGIIGLESDAVKSTNAEIKEEVNEHIDKKFTIDDFSQYSPFMTVYALNYFGIKGQHSLKNRTKLLASSYLLMGATVLTIKNTGRVERPDGSSKNSFPSGHTATAFMGAEFLYQEYKETSPWIGGAGYLVAAGTGFFRMYNNRHWLTDVSAGAGIGILSTKISYWLSKYFINEDVSISATPNFKNQNLGIKISFNF